MDAIAQSVIMVLRNISRSPSAEAHPTRKRLRFPRDQVPLSGEYHEGKWEEDHFRSSPGTDIVRPTRYVRKVPCVDGSGLARRIFTSQAWSVLPCVRPVGAVHMTAGHNALRGSGPGQKPAFDNAMALVPVANQIRTYL